MATALFSLANFQNCARSAGGIFCNVCATFAPKKRFKVVVVLWHLLHLNVGLPFDMGRHRVISVFSLQRLQTTQEAPQWFAVSMFHASTFSMPLRFELVEEGGSVP